MITSVPTVQWKLGFEQIEWERWRHTSQTRSGTIHQTIMTGHHGPALNWYRALVWNLNRMDEHEAGLSIKMSCPVLGEVRW